MLPYLKANSERQGTMRILLTGGTGLIGSSLIKFLTNHHSVVVLTRNVAKAYQKCGHGIEAVQYLDEVDFNALDAVINLAGEPIADKRWSEKQKSEIEQSRFILTELISDKINQASNPPHTFISGSAIGYYGRQGPHSVTEKHKNPHDEFSHRLCAEWERLALRAEDKTRVVLLRTGIVLDPSGGALKKMLPAFKCGLGGKMASGDQYMSWIHIHDMVSLIEHCLEDRQISGPVNATAPYPVTNARFTELLAKALNRPALLPMPEAVLRLLFGEMADLLIYGQKVMPQVLAERGFHFRYATLDNALNHLVAKTPTPTP